MNGAIDVRKMTNEAYLDQDAKIKAQWQKDEQEYKAAMHYARRNRPKLKKIMRHYIKTDLFFLCTRVLNMHFIYETERPWWIWDRCRMIQEEPNGCLDIWAREHFKSTLVTFAKTIQDILTDPEVTIGIFSFNRPIAKKFLIQIKQELESNELLKWLFPEILWDDPRRESIKHGFKWSENEGITVKRKGNPKESTIEAWGLVDAQPTSKHFQGRIYDDVITIDSVTSPEMIKKVTAAWEMSSNLGKDGGWERYIGTFYHYADTYKVMIDRKAVKLRKFPCFHNGTEDGVNVLQSRGYLAKKRKSQGGSTFSAQMLCDPKEEGSMGFKREWLNFWGAESYHNMNFLIFVDPASKKKKASDYTTMWVIGLGSDQNFYVADIVRDKMSLTERARTFFALHRKWRPKRTYYEEYGLQADVEHMEFCMKLENYRFHIDTVGGRVKKEDRIGALVPILENGRLYMLQRCIKVDYQREPIDLVYAFIHEEYLDFPFSEHDDMLDSLARITDSAVDLPWPKEEVRGDSIFNPEYMDVDEEYDPLAL